GVGAVDSPFDFQAEWKIVTGDHGVEVVRGVVFVFFSFFFFFFLKLFNDLRGVFLQHRGFLPTRIVNTHKSLLWLCAGIRLRADFCAPKAGPKSSLKMKMAAPALCAVRPSRPATYVPCRLGLIV